MSFPGPLEILVIAAIFIVAIVIPLSIVLLLIYLVKSTKSPQDDDRHQ